jgi:hypothetical protein
MALLSQDGLSQHQQRGSENRYSRNHDGVRPPGPIASYPHPLLPLAELAFAHDFAIELHSPATRKAYRSDFALFALG